MTPTLPAQIETYFQASNAAKPEDLAGAFASEGEVRDERETHRGREAIAAWARGTQERYGMQSTPLVVEQAGDDYAVTARVSGNFSGSPLDLTYRFRLSSAGIRSLEIG